MAGVDGTFEGEAQTQKGIRIGYLERDSKLLKGMTVGQNVEESAGEIRGHLEKYKDLGLKLGEKGLGEEE